MVHSKEYEGYEGNETDKCAVISKEKIKML